MTLREAFTDVRPRPAPRRRGRPPARGPGRLPRGAHRAGPVPGGGRRLARLRHLDRRGAALPAHGARRGPARRRHAVPPAPRRPGRRQRGDRRRSSGWPRPECIATVGRHRGAARRGQRDPRPGRPQPRPARRDRRRARRDVGRDARRDRRSCAPRAGCASRSSRPTARRRRRAPPGCRRPSSRASARTGDADPMGLWSRAGHDAMAIAAVTDVGDAVRALPRRDQPPPDEDVRAVDVARGLDAFEQTRARGRRGGSRATRSGDGADGPARPSLAAAARAARRPALRPGESLLAGGTWLFSEPQPGGHRAGRPDHARLGALGARRTAGCGSRRPARSRELLSIPAEVLGRPPTWSRQCADAFLMSFKIAALATVGGNLCLALPAGAMISLLVALDADGRRVDPRRRRAARSRSPTSSPACARRRSRPARCCAPSTCRPPRCAARTRSAGSSLTPLGRSVAVVVGRRSRPTAVLIASPPPPPGRSCSTSTRRTARRARAALAASTAGTTTRTAPPTGARR